jgi:acetyl esterase/lipase
MQFAPAGAQAYRVLYRSTGMNGEPIAVSGVAVIPPGAAPANGRPIVAWAHPTTGVVPHCAPSLALFVFQQMQGLRPLIERGAVVVATDYPGLGTPGPHPYLVGPSEAHAVLDSVRVARDLPGAGGASNFAVWGHSQGGHAALWAGSLAGKWTPELDVRGTLALAPASHLGEQAGLLGALTSPSPLSGLAAMIVRGVDVEHQDLGVASLLSDRARALFPQVDEVCLGDLREQDSFGGIAPAELFRPGVDLGPTIAKLNENDPETLKIRHPVQIEQGTGDTTVLPLFTNQLVPKLNANGVKVTYKTYEGVTHGGAVTDAHSAADATKYIRARFR